MGEKMIIVLHSSVETTYTFMDVLQRYSLAVIIILSLFFAGLLGLFLVYRRRVRRFNREQKKSREKLEEALEVAREASEAKTTFLSSMSHDIRTPMNAIVGMTLVAMEHADDKEKVKDCLEKISLSSHHLLTLINNVLDISKIESGKLALNPVVFSLRDTMATIVNITKPRLKEKNLDFEVHINGIEYETLYADEVRINQIFINLLTNAVKYTPEGGKVTMELTEKLLTDGRTVRLTYVVEDNGIGMSEEFMENMYDNFARAEDSRIKGVQGSGLGLTIVRQMVELMNGSIDCKSKEGQGTVFTVVLDLPIRRQNVKKIEISDIRVLVVDDDEVFLENAGESLEHIGVHADTASGGEEAVELMKTACEKNEPYRVVIVDWKMPGMDGMETVRAIREIMDDEVSIILVSAYDWSDIEHKAKESGINGFINKLLFRSYIYEKLCDVLHLDESSSVAEEIMPDDLSGKHLLIAEDNELNWEIMDDLLSMHGISAERAENGKVCVDMLTSAEPGTYDLILMDIQMPVMNGREATQRIREDEREYVRTIPIVAMTAEAFAEDIEANIEVGMDGHLSKPVDIDSLLQEVRRVLDT